jgi:hypothetical protein
LTSSSPLLDALEEVGRAVEGVELLKSGNGLIPNKHWNEGTYEDLLLTTLSAPALLLLSTTTGRCLLL